MFGLGGVSKRLSAGIQKAGEMLSVGPSAKLRNTIINEDEDKAILLYLGDPQSKTRGIEHELGPSSPFTSTSKSKPEETPLHLACECALLRVVEMFLEKGGNPNKLNGLDKTCLHSICLRGDKVDIRKMIMQRLLSWHGSIPNQPIDEGSSSPSASPSAAPCAAPSLAPEMVSINRVDIDGNSAVHYAAFNGLLEMVEMLLSSGAIISIVNKEQRTCCDSADINGHKQLADMLELALVFQPADEGMENFDEALLMTNGPKNAVLALDCSGMATDDLRGFIDGLLCTICALTDEPPSRAESLLESFSWDIKKLAKEYQKNKSEVYKNAHIADVHTPDVPPVVVRTTDARTQDNKLQAAVVDDVLIDFSDSGMSDDGGNADQQQATKASNTDDDAVDDGAAAGSSSSLLDAATIAANAAAASLQTKEATAGGLGTPSSSPIGICGICGEDLLPSIDYPTAFTAITTARSGATATATTTAAGATAGVATAGAAAGATTAATAGSSNASSVVVVNVGDTEIAQRSLSCGSGHTYCMSCWGIHAAMQVRENSAFSLKCPGYKCGALLDLEWSEVLLPSPQLLFQFEDQRTRHVVDCCPSLRWCVHEGCNSVLNIQSELISGLDTNYGTLVEKVLPQCVSCDRGHAFCLSCAGEAHSPCSCDEWRKWELKVSEEMKIVNSVTGSTNAATQSGDEIANALWVAANTKRCPRCTLPIEKDEGCNHMTCRKCRYEFCWICMQDWSLHNNATGGYFQCNRFYAAAANGSGGGTTGAATAGGDGGSAVGDAGQNGGDGAAAAGANMRTDLPPGLYADDAGSSHFESLRTKYVAQKMARFIHHYSRYQAHGDSALLEKRMQTDTIMRIQTNLRLVQLDKLKWLQGELVPVPFIEINYDDNDDNNGANAGDSSSSSGGYSGNKISATAAATSALMSSPASTMKKAAGGGGGGGSPSSPSSLSSSSPSRSSSSSFFNKMAGGLKLLPSSFRSASSSAAARSRNITTTTTTGANDNDNGNGKQSANDSIKAAAGGSNGTSAGGGAVAVSSFSSTMDFLMEGFVELLKCRQILRSSFAYSFYAFGDEGADKDRGILLGMQVPKKSRTMTESRRQNFEMLQAELETVTEMLSDVVARKRLRAARTQILQLTKAARLRRLQLEETAYNYTLSDVIAMEEYDLIKRSRAYRSPGTNDSNKSSGGMNGIGDLTSISSNSNSSSSTPVVPGLGHRTVHILQQSPPAAAAPLAEGERRTAAFRASASRFRRQLREARYGTNNYTAATGTGTGATARTQLASSSSRTPSDTRSDRRLVGDDDHELAAGGDINNNNNNHSTSNNDVSDAGDGDGDAGDDVDYGDDDDAALLQALSAAYGNEHNQSRLSRLALREEEEAALSRAILLSLGQMDHDHGQQHAVGGTIATATAIATAANDDVVGSVQQRGGGAVAEEEEPPQESDIEAVMALGFERDAVIAALKSSRNNIERAVDSLLS